MDNSLLHSYVNTRDVNGISIPLPIQTVYLRNYAKTNNYTLSFPNVEWTNSNSYYCLKNLLFNKKVDNICVCSIFLIQFNMFKSIKYTDIANAKHTLLHYPLEQKILTLKESIKYYDKYMQIRRKECKYANIFNRIQRETR